MRLKDSIVQSLDDKQALDISVIESEFSCLADYTVIATGRSTKNVFALARHLSHYIKTFEKRSVNIEGMEKAEWVILDTGNIIIHIFHPDIRKHYNLEQLYSVVI